MVRGGGGGERWCARERDNKPQQGPNTKSGAVMRGNETQPQSAFLCLFAAPSPYCLLPQCVCLLSLSLCLSVFLPLCLPLLLPHVCFLGCCEARFNQGRQQGIWWCFCVFLSCFGCLVAFGFFAVKDLKWTKMSIWMRRQGFKQHSRPRHNTHTQNKGGTTHPTNTKTLLLSVGRSRRPCTWFGFGRWWKDLNRAHEVLGYCEHGSGVVKLPAVVWCSKDGHQLSLSKKLVAILNNLFVCLVSLVCWKFVGDGGWKRWSEREESEGRRGKRRRIWLNEWM